MRCEWGAKGKEPACHCRTYTRHEFDPWAGKIPWRRAWQPTPAFLPGESHGQRNLVGYSPVGSQKCTSCSLLALEYFSLRFFFFLFFTKIKILLYSRIFFLGNITNLNDHLCADEFQIFISSALSERYLFNSST